MAIRDSFGGRFRRTLESWGIVKPRLVPVTPEIEIPPLTIEQLNAGESIGHLVGADDKTSTNGEVRYFKECVDLASLYRFPDGSLMLKVENGQRFYRNAESREWREGIPSWYKRK